MAQGTPVVAIAELGTASILIEGEGAVIAPEDELIFMQKVRSLLLNPVHRQHLGERGRAYAQSKWSALRQAEHMVTYYADLISASVKIKQPVIDHQAVLKEL